MNRMRNNSGKKSHSQWFPESIVKKYLTKEVKDPLTENYKLIRKKLKKTPEDSKTFPYPWARRINIVKMTIQLKAIYRVTAISIKVLMPVFI
jgi:hypothetical protein